MPEYVATNTTTRSGPGEQSSRSVLKIDGSTLHPERTYHFSTFTSDILEAMKENNLQVETEQGVPVTIETLEKGGRELKTRTVTEMGSNVDGRVRYENTEYYLEEAPEDADGEEQVDPDETDEGDKSEENDEEDAQEDTEDEAPEDETTEEEAGKEETTEEEASDDSAGEEAGEEPGSGVIEELKAKGAIPENAETSSDVNAAPMSKIIRQVGDRIPESFFEGESRKTVLSELDA
jgi:hypothetical protein